METVWYVNWEDNSSIWSSKEKAFNAIEQECARLGATVHCNCEDSAEYYILTLIYENGYEIQVDVVEYPLNKFPCESVPL